jgi:hypothetical protein
LIVQRALRLLGKTILSLVVIIGGVAVGKAFQYSAVDAFGGLLGFDLASLIGFIPFALLLLWLAKRFPPLAGTRSRSKSNSE